MGLVVALARGTAVVALERGVVVVLGRATALVVTLVMGLVVALVRATALVVALARSGGLLGLLQVEDFLIVVFTEGVARVPFWVAGVTGPVARESLALRTSSKLVPIMSPCKFFLIFS